MAGGNRETVGAITIAAAVLLLIGAVRGTWQKLFRDVVLGQEEQNVTAGSSVGSAVGSAVGTGIEGAAGTGSGAGAAVGSELRRSPPITSAAPAATMDAAIPTSPQSGPLLAAAGAISPPPGVAGTVWRQAGS